MRRVAGSTFITANAWDTVSNGGREPTDGVPIPMYSAGFHAGIAWALLHPYEAQLALNEAEAALEESQGASKREDAVDAVNHDAREWFEVTS